MKVNFVPFTLSFGNEQTEGQNAWVDEQEPQIAGVMLAVTD